MLTKVEKDFSSLMNTESHDKIEAVAFNIGIFLIWQLGKVCILVGCKEKHISLSN